MKMIVMILTNQRQNMRKENRKHLNDKNSREREREKERERERVLIFNALSSAMDILRRNIRHPITNKSLNSFFMSHVNLYLKNEDERTCKS